MLNLMLIFWLTVSISIWWTLLLFGTLRHIQFQEYFWEHIWAILSVKKIISFAHFGLKRLMANTLLNFNDRGTIMETRRKTRLQRLHQCLREKEARESFTLCCVSCFCHTLCRTRHCLQSLDIFEVSQRSPQEMLNPYYEARLGIQYLYFVIPWNINMRFKL